MSVDYFYYVRYAFPPERYSLKVGEFSNFGILSDICSSHKIHTSANFAFPHLKSQSPTQFPALLVTGERRRSITVKDIPHIKNYLNKSLVMKLRGVEIRIFTKNSSSIVQVDSYEVLISNSHQLLVLTIFNILNLYITNSKF